MTTNKGKLFYQIQLKDKLMQSVLSEAVHMIYSEAELASNVNYRGDARRFIKKYAESSACEISWKFLCLDRTKTYIYKFRIALIVVLLKRNLYSYDDKSDLEKLIPIFENHLTNYRTEWIHFFNNVQIRDVFVKEKSSTGSLTIYKVPRFSGYLRDCVISFFNSHYSEIYKNKYIQLFCNSLADSIPCTVNNYTDFESHIFFNQLNFYKEIDPVSLVYVKILIHFYRMLFKKYPNYVFFKESLHISMSVLLNDKFMAFLQDSYISEDRTFVINTGRISFIVSLPFTNTALTEIVVAFYKSNTIYLPAINLTEFMVNFEKSLGKFFSCINCYADFNEKTFWTQINYYKDFYSNRRIIQREALSYVCYFYRHLVNAYKDNSIFADSLTIIERLLYNSNLISRILSGYVFVNYNPYGVAPDAERVVYTLRGFDKYSTRLASEDYLTLDLSPISERIYRQFLHEYLQSSTSVMISCCGNHFSTFNIVLPKIIKMKSQPNYPNRNLLFFTNQEALLIRNLVYNKANSLPTLNNNIGALRRFFIWAQSTGKMRFDVMFFEYFKQFEEPGKTTTKSIPDDVLILLNGLLQEKARDQNIYLLVYTIFHLLLQTEFRISQICRLKVDCIKTTAIPGQYRIVANSKTSHGERYSYVITNLTYHLLMKIIDATESYRERCSIKTYKNSIFLFEGLYNTVHQISAGKFSNCMEICCKELNLGTVYSANSLRDTHMTKAFEHVLRTGKSNIEMSLLSKHKYIDTTKNHYIQVELEKMLEATYGITIGHQYIDTTFKVYDDVPTEAEGSDSDVQEGCGKCVSSKCVFTSLLPCLVCKFFITTVEHERFFIKSIANIDNMITHAICRHDLEDLILIKSLYVLYLEEIYKHKEKLITK